MTNSAFKWTNSQALCQAGSPTVALPHACGRVSVDFLVALALLQLVLGLGVLAPLRVARLVERHSLPVIAAAVLAALAFTLARNTVAPWLAPV